MAEVSHADIYARVGSVERAQQGVEAHIVRLDARVGDLAARSADNRDYTNQQIRQLAQDLAEHRAEFAGMAKGIKFGMGVIGFLISAGISVIGVLLA